MGALLKIRDTWNTLYARLNIWLIPAAKFATMFGALVVMNSMIGYRELLTKWAVIVLISLVCSLLPWVSITVISMVLAVANLSALCWEAAMVAAAFIIIAGMLHYLFLPGCSIAIILVPVCFYLKIPYVVPLILGIVGGASSFIPAGLGVFAYYFMLCIQKNAAALLDTSVDTTIMTRFTLILTALRDNQLMLLGILAFCIAGALVYALRRLSLDYARTIAIVVGGIVMILLYLIGGVTLGLSIPYIDVVVGVLVSVLIALAVQFSRIAVDYSRTEYLQYEDDEYVYHVKAVPKVRLSEKNRKVREINSRRKEKHEEPSGEAPEARQTSSEEKNRSQ